MGIEMGRLHDAFFKGKLAVATFCEKRKDSKHLTMNRLGSGKFEMMYKNFKVWIA
jgi:hypothetical protein